MIQSARRSFFSLPAGRFPGAEKVCRLPKDPENHVGKPEKLRQEAAQERGGKMSAQAVGQAVGRNQAVGMKLLEMCRHMGMDAFAVRPLQKTMRVGSGTQQMWGGTDGKVRADELERLLADNGRYMPKGRTNQDERDAVLIALRAAGYAIYPRKVFARQAHIN